MTQMLAALLTDIRVTATDDSEGLGASEAVVAAKKKSNLPENLRLPASLLVAHKRRKQVPALMQPHELRQNRRALCKLIGAYINAEAGRALSTMVNEECEKLDSDGDDLLSVDLFRAWTTAGEELTVRAGAGAFSDPLEVYHLA